MVRLLTEHDIPGAMRLKEAANWNQTEDDWRNILRLAPQGCFGIDCEGRLAASATAATFANGLAWIGMVLTDPEMRRRGFGRELMEHAIACLEAQRIPWIKLDATDMGRPLYARLGFEDECPIERWGRQPAPCTGPELPPVTEIPLTLDREATGADRSEMLALLAGIESASLGPDAYAMGRAGSKAAYFGPCVSRDPAAVRELLRWFLARHAQDSIYWDILPDNAAAVAIARESGFEPLRRLTRMVRPGIPDPPRFLSNNCHVFAIAGFEYG